MSPALASPHGFSPLRGFRSCAGSITVPHVPPPSISRASHLLQRARIIPVATSTHARMRALTDALSAQHAPCAQATSGTRRSFSLSLSHEARPVRDTAPERRATQHSRPQHPLTGLGKSGVPLPGLRPGRWRFAPLHRGDSRRATDPHTRSESGPARGHRVRVESPGGTPHALPEPPRHLAHTSSCARARTRT